MIKDFLIIVWTVFLLEFADKTQLAAISFATRQNPLVVYIGVVIGLSIATVISVAVGKTIGVLLPTRYIKLVAGVLFILIGLWTIFGK